LNASIHGQKTMAAPARRAYKRHSDATWEKHKDTIRGLFLEQNNKYEEVSAALKASHGFDVG
jgi:hypothetical protein